MPDYTGNLNLAKPIPNEDSADIRVINENMDKIDEWSTEINKKTKGATSEAAGIVKYGTDVSTALEGSKLAEILGIEYGGVLNNNNQKVAGKGYYDTANKKIYKCTTNTTINYADAGYFIEVSNNDLLGKLQNLYVYKTLQVIVPYEIYSNKVFQIPEGTKFLSIYMARTATTEHRDFRFIDLNFLSIATPSQSIAWITRRYDINRYIYEDLTIKNGTIEMGTNNEVAHFIVAHI